MMMPNFNPDHYPRRVPPNARCAKNSINPSPVDGLVDSMDNLKRDRFELLSAYLDGEVTPAERRQVEDWLANDSTVQQLYARLLRLRQGLRTMPVPVAERPVEQTVQGVLSSLERKPRRTAVWGGAAIAALMVGALSTVMIPATTSHFQKLAEMPEPPLPAGTGLMVALDRPIMEIPDVSEVNSTVLPQAPLNGALNKLRTKSTDR